MNSEVLRFRVPQPLAACNLNLATVAPSSTELRPGTAIAGCGNTTKQKFTVPRLPIFSAELPAVGALDF